ncbi:sensor domain-containing diguanylate cyclase [Nocardioides sp. zg-ZUI104]|uniref:diguanylate cyclase domain-containing protein n=1 Tax=Nocardioides faecalis TaxID=2803858 RepID=UPI001BCC6667|nr:diguanylate cyclase [Nocardioides faecalis]MBS4754659.1 sensor domain-containing diguanylate cyclase [Nocardioides faecalis]
MGRPGKALWSALAYAAVYVVCVLAGRATKVDDATQISLIWPAAAVSVLWGLHAQRLGGRAGAAHWAALTLVTALTSWAVDGVSAIWFTPVGLTFTGVSVWLLTRRGGESREACLREPVDLARLVLAVGVASVVSSALAAMYFAWAGDDRLHMSALHYAVRNAVTALAVVAVGLRLRETSWPPRLPSPARLAEAVASAVLVTAVFAAVLWFNNGLPLAFLAPLPAMWVALRYSTTSGSVFVLVAGVAIVTAGLDDQGVFEGFPPRTRALLAQAMVGSLTVIVLTLALMRDSRTVLITRLRHLAQHDPLTGLANRALLTERLQTALDRCRREGTAVGVVFIDLDGFKKVNDGWGHGEGDLLLVEIARRLRRVAGPRDTVARIGGDEFVLVHLDAPDEEALRLCADRVRDAVAAPYGDAADAPFDRITASVGLAISDGECTVRSLLHNADRAMYEVKHGDRGMTPAHWLSDL